MITDGDIEHLVTLARIGVSLAGKKALAEDLERILEYVGELSLANTENVEPMARPVRSKTSNGAGGTELANRLREDEERIDSFEDKGALLEMAPERKNRYFKVPRILE